MSDNLIMKSLAEVPQLVEAFKQSQEENEKKFKILGELTQQRVEAKLSEDEHAKLLADVKEVIQGTRCATPDIAEVTEHISQGVVDGVKGAVKEAAEEAVRNSRVAVKQTHVYTSTFDLARVAEKKTKNMLTILLILIVTLLGTLGIGAYCYFHSKTYWGKEYWEIVCSPYATEAESTMLWKDYYITGGVPKEFESRPSYVKSKIRQNKQVLRDRKAEAKTKNGKFSTKVPLER